MELLQYFNDAAHRGSTTRTEFESRLSDLEQIILETHCRQPPEDFSAIDSLLGEEEATGA